MHVDLGACCHAHHFVIGEVVLRNSATFDRDLAIHRGREAENDAALDLRGCGVGIHCKATVDRTCHLVHNRTPIFAHRDLSDFGNHTAKAFLYCDT